MAFIVIVIVKVEIYLMALGPAYDIEQMLFLAFPYLSWHFFQQFSLHAYSGESGVVSMSFLMIKLVNVYKFLYFFHKFVLRHAVINVGFLVQESDAQVECHTFGFCFDAIKLSETLYVLF